MAVAGLTSRTGATRATRATSLIFLQVGPLPILCIVSGEILDFALAFKHQQMVHHLIHKVAVVRYHNHAPGKILQVFLQNLQRHNVQVVGRLVQHQEVGVAHQHGAKVQFSALTTAQFIHIIILLLGRKQEILQQLRGRQFLATAQLHIVRNIGDHVDNFLLLIELQSFLREVPEPHRITYHDVSFVHRFQSQQHLDKRRLTRSVRPHNTHLLKP